MPDTNRDHSETPLPVFRMLTAHPRPYEPTWEAMKQLATQRGPVDADEIWFLQHQPVFTQGQAGKAEHLLAPGDIPVVKIDRGGQVTYHGPGQLTVYFMLDLKRNGLGARALVTLIEEAVVELLALYQISAHAKKEAPGVYVSEPPKSTNADANLNSETHSESKIASLGLRIKRGFSYHGVAINVAMDLSPFQRINPCGYAGMAMTQISHYEPTIQLSDVAEQFAGVLKRKLAYNLTTTTHQPWSQ